MVVQGARQAFDMSKRVRGKFFKSSCSFSACIWNETASLVCKVDFGEDASAGLW